MALENNATETQANIKFVTLLTKTIAKLSTQVTTLTAKLVTAQSENPHIKIYGNRVAN